MDREVLLDELARCYMRAAVDAFLIGSMKPDDDNTPDSTKARRDGRAFVSTPGEHRHSQPREHRYEKHITFQDIQKRR